MSLVQTSILRSLSWWRASVQTSLRAAIALVMIASLGLAQFGYPVYEVAVKKGDQPFPCQFSRCGCQTAEQCRTSCCCHSKRERVAWAVERGIDPDRVAVLTPAEKLKFTFGAGLVAKKRSCCQATAQKNCCEQERKVASCCESTRLGGKLALPINANEVLSAPKQLRWVTAIAAQRCHGTGVEWIQAGFVAQPPLRVTLSIEIPEARVVSDVRPVYFSPVAEPLLRPV